MALSLLSVNICQFNDCGLHFANLHDLLQHIEETHIPAIEEEMVKRSTTDDETVKNATLTTTWPLSTICRWFTKLPPQKANPIKYEPTKLAIGHYRKKSLMSAVASMSGFGQLGERSRLDNDEESNDSFKNEDGDDYEQGADERRHKCPVEGCNKRYKNLQGARYHARQVHGYMEENNMNSASASFDLTPHVPGQVAPLIQSGAPSKYANLRPYKCSQCSKRYKTIVGLNNHVQQSHQRINSVGSQNLTNFVPVSTSTASISTTRINALSTVASNQVTAAEGDGSVAVASNYLPLTAVHGATQIIRTGTVGSLSSVASHQYQQQQPLATKVVPTGSNSNSSTGLRNMNILSAYGPQPAEFSSPTTSRSDVSSQGVHERSGNGEEMRENKRMA